VLAELVHADALHGGGHHHAREAGLGLAHVQRQHRLARAERHLVGQVVESRLAARGRRVAPERRAERRIDEQALDQLGGDVGLGGGHGLSRRASARSTAWQGRL
jgi:hypothetical protein